MRLNQAALNILHGSLAAWFADWAWGVPLIVMTVIIHIIGLGLASHKITHPASRTIRSGHRYRFVVVTGATTLVATCLHAVEAAIWAASYQFLGALPDARSAMLYSLNAITSYGHTDLSLGVGWQLMGAMEALNGWLLFGLSAAFLFAVIEKVWLSGSGGGNPALTP